MTISAINPKLLASDVYQEAKEAVADALINMTVARCTGEGAFGEIVYGKLPQAAFVSGLLLPRYDETGQEDETNDIRIAVLGMDFQVRSNASGEAMVTPDFITYLRVLPSWEEITVPHLKISPEFPLQKEFQQQFMAEIRARVQERYKAENLFSTKDGKPFNPEAWKQISLRRKTVEQEVRQEVCAAHGITLSAKSENASPALITDRSDAEGTMNTDAAPEAGELAIGGNNFLQGNSSWPAHLVRPAEIPMKWKRIKFSLPAFTWDIGAMPSEDQIKQYNLSLQQAARNAIQAWLDSPTGRDEAWREVDVLPQHVANKGAWDQFLNNLRTQNPDTSILMPPLNGIELTVQVMQDFTDTDINCIRVALENNNQQLTRVTRRRHTSCIFQVQLSVVIPKKAHHPLQLDRIEPSYRFRHYLNYPAIGLNNGIHTSEHGNNLHLKTTWAPRFVQPRIKPTAIDGVLYKFGELADEKTDPVALMQLVKAYRQWITTQENRLRTEVRQGLDDPADADRESDTLRKDAEQWKKEASLIEKGINLLIESYRAWNEAKSASAKNKAHLERRSIPWQAWRLMNESFFDREEKNPDKGWRLFQLAFVLGHLPCLASRMQEFHDWYDSKLDDETASLLYFPTGGGKSEAFYGVLVYGLFLDRLRGKQRGVTSLVRYPLRLLTLQQAQRLLKLLVRAELIRHKHAPQEWPFEIGFWVGSANTPNRVSEFKGIPNINDNKHIDDQSLDPDKLSTSDDQQMKAAEQYQLMQHSYNKIPLCPLCDHHTGLRIIKGGHKDTNRAGIVCFNAACEWNVAHPGKDKTPLPFLLTDDTIYQRAPSVILGTVDKLAMIGYYPRTITMLMGMFGAARWITPEGHFLTPREVSALSAGAKANGCAEIFPAYTAGQHIFHDPFPSIIIQDEAHLLEESLGTFSGLFETALESVFSKLAATFPTEVYIARAGNSNRPRPPKIIAATATVASPKRQLEMLYQREAMLFPYPGPDLYRSFYAEPAEIPQTNPERIAYAKTLSEAQAAEKTAPWMRVYLSLMTNGANHTVTTVAALSAFHLCITELWRGLANESTCSDSANLLLSFISSGKDGEWRRAALEKLINEKRFDIIFTLIDLHRIALTYVTNKKGGDQVMDALETQAKRDHDYAGTPLASFQSELISGGVDVSEIQDIMQKAESTAGNDIVDKVRSIIATSAISHGVDVDRFNSMFFAGLPADIAEYIQASSRVGRTHVGFVLLMPTPQSRRDRYVVETHDIFHRFLERMIAPPAAERWADNAIKRVASSFIQTWCMLEEIHQFHALADSGKQSVDSYDILKTLNRKIAQDSVGIRDSLCNFMHSAMGLHGRGESKIGEPNHEVHYRRLIEKNMDEFVKFAKANPSSSRLKEYWASTLKLPRPMTSLRDVDEAGSIVPSPHYINESLALDVARWNKAESIAEIMRVIRGQQGETGDLDDDSPMEGEAA